MSDDPDSPPEREMKDFQFRQLKKIRVFDSPADLPKDRSSLLAVSNKFGLIFVGLENALKVYMTREILSADKVDGNSNEKIEVTPALVEVSLEHPVHHLALSCDELTLSICGMSAEAVLSIDFYDVRTFMKEPAVDPGTSVQDLKWNPAQASMLAVCLSDGSMIVVDVTDRVSVQAQLTASNGITCICWSPKGKQVAVGKMNATVSQYTPALQEKKVIPCPNFYSSDNPVKVLDVLWLRTFVFAVVYAAADGSLETPPELVVISLPKKDEKTEARYLNFNDPVYGTCVDRQHHYFLSQIEDWDVVFATSAASIEVSVIAKDKNHWELWILEDASRAELPVSQSNEDTLPLGLAIDYTSQQEIYISDEKTLPPAPIMLLLSTDGVLCPFSLLNLNPGSRQMVCAPVAMPSEGERLPLPGSGHLSAPRPAAPLSTLPAAFPALRPISSAVPSPAPPAASSAPAPFSVVSAAPASSSATAGFSFALPTSMTSAPAPPAFSLGGAAAFSSGFSFASKPPTVNPAVPSAFAFSTPSARPPTEGATAQVLAAQRLATASPLTVFNTDTSTPAVKLNLSDRFSAVEAPAPASQAFSFSPATGKPLSSEPSGLATPPPSASKLPVMPAPVRPIQTNNPPPAVLKPGQASQGTASQTALCGKALDKQLQQKRGSDPIMTGILEEIAHFQKELDDLKARSLKADFKVGTSAEMKELKKDSEDLHVFTLEIRETTESLHGDIGTLKTSLLEGFAGAEDATSQNELAKDRGYLQLLCKKPLDPRSEEKLKEIRRLYQYVMFAVEDVNDVLDMEWEKHLEKKKKQKHMVVPGREALFATLANNLFIINQQKTRLDRLIKELSSLQLYTKTAAWTAAPAATSGPTATDTPASLDHELDSLREALLKAKLDTASPKQSSKTQASKLSPVKRSQLRNFLSKGQMPPVRSTAPANLSRSAFLSPKYYEDLDDVSSTSSLSQSLEPHPAHLELGEEEELESEPLPLPVISQTASLPRHPTVVRTASIQPGFGVLQSTPASKMPSALGMGVALSPIACPVPTNKIFLGGADSTALATKTVKHGAPPTERSVPVTIPAQQAAATAALRRQMANQKPGASLTECTLKTVPQVVNVQELEDKGPAMPVSTVISSSVPAPAAQVIQQVLATVAASNQAKRNTTQGVFKVTPESATTPQSSFVFGGGPKTDASVSSSAEQNSSKGFSFTSPPSSFSFASVSQGPGSAQAKDGTKFAFGGSSKNMFGSAGDDLFFVSKSGSPAFSSSSSTPPPNVSGEPVRPSSTTPALRVEPQAPAPVGGETLGSFSGLRVGQGDDEAKDAPAAPNGKPGFVDNAAAPGPGKGSVQFSFGAPEGGLDTSKGMVSVSTGGVFKPPELNAKLAFPIPQATSSPAALPTSLSSLLAAALDPAEEPASSPRPPDTPSAADQETPAGGPAVTEASPADTAVPTEPTAGWVKAQTPPPATPAAVPSPAPPPTEAASQAQAPAAPAVEPAPDGEPASELGPSTGDATQEAVPQSAPPSYQASTSGKTASIFAPPTPVTTDGSSIGAVPVIITAAPAATTLTQTIADTGSTTTNTVFSQPAADPPSSGPVATGFSSTAFGTPAATGFGKSLFGQGVGFDQLGTNTGTPSSSFSFGQSAFGTSASGATTCGGGGLFGAPTPANASSFSFGSGSANTSSTTGTGLFGATPAFGQQSSSFGQGSVFGNNTSTTASTGFSFSQPSAFGSSPSASVFGQQPGGGGSVFGQQQQQPAAVGGGLFGAPAAGTAGAAGASGGFFSGLGGKPSEDAANKNPFGAAVSPGGFGQPGQAGAPGLFGSSGAKNFAFGQSSFGEQKGSGTFSTGAGSVAAQGFGSFTSPTKPGGFGSAPVFGSPPSFGGSPAFGSGASFGSAPTFSNNMGPTAGKVFGEGTAASNVGGFGFASPQSAAPSFGALANQSAPSFGGLAQQGPGFGAQPSSFAGFGQPPQGAFSGGSFASPNQSPAQTFASWRS